MDVLKLLSCLFALCFYLTRPETFTMAKSYKIFKTEIVELQKSTTLYIDFPNMERPVEWKCKHYTYECDKTCTNTTEFQVTQSGNDSTLWIRDVTNECLSWTFYDNNNNFGKFDLETNGSPKAETYEITQNDDGTLDVSATLQIEVPNMKRPAVWRYNNYKYECDLTCANSPEYRVTQSGDVSTFWIQSVTKERLDWTFNDDNFNYGKFDLKMHSLTRTESYNITQSGPVALGGSVTLHIEVANMNGIVFWKNNYSRYECNPACYNYGNYEVTQNGNSSNLLIRNVTKQDLTWHFCDLYLCSENYSLVTKEETETTTTKDVTTTTKAVETNGGLPIYGTVLLSILGFVVLFLIVTFVVIFKCKLCEDIKDSIIQCISSKEVQK